ncbi:Carboxylesterase [Cooperia oncophora]
MGQASSLPEPCGESRVVKTKFGSVVGRRFVFDKKEVDAFQGVPFAKPPVGDLRFQKPQWPDPWDDVKTTNAFAARGIQKDSFFFEKLKLVRMSEDNLYLNVFTPVWNPKKESGFPVLVFVHGGGFVSDSSVKYGDVGICEHLCTKDVVVVTIQYRLGLLGFFSTGDEHCPGNLALWDQTLALRWIQVNFLSGLNSTQVSLRRFNSCSRRDLFTFLTRSRTLKLRSVGDGLHEIKRQQLLGSSWLLQ